ncbi:MAG: DNA-directed RNA polymerase subunit beta [Chitinophagaceae bacterium]|jgi:DNA-directed RNA polymerase subunit beta|nr:DNA-directed RNA polymerase subunit beta [Chitinophagaceae bacterium]MBK7679044.1 DNA-directed RNA polymerase subunit beta [Chitinophagaceae bacterium]MBK8299611.1 DNA-directed RNA polymerase subunit beta [Chitinophagaceae bacterium]MBK9463662.1 DNA-directed RNA polymerase subunit beta [Chitinophagaceae bacterium]MBK9937256.1 DNA-directed RNA polymerase subunit beta [Chitinophagaceae bacterium]
MSSTKVNSRVDFGKIKHLAETPDLLEVQIQSFKEFFQLETTPDKRNVEGLFRVFKDNFPITDTRNIFVLEFLDYFIDPPRYTIEECMERGLTYAVPLKAKLRLSCNDEEHVDFQTIVQDVFLGNIPYMTPRGTFVINGAERVVVSQLHRSPGVFFGQSVHPNGTKIYSARVIPFKGAWMEFATDINNVMYAYIDRKKKFPVTTLLRSIGYETDKDILELFGMADEVKTDKKTLGKYIGKRLAARVLRTWVEDFVDEDTGEVVSIERNEIVMERDTVLDDEAITTISEMDVKSVFIQREDVGGDYAIIYNTLNKDTSNSELEAVQFIYRQLRGADAPDNETARGIIDKLFFSDKRYDLGEVGRYKINRKLNVDLPLTKKTLTREDIILIIKYLVRLTNGKAEIDDIDHLSNRRVRTVGEQLYAQFGVGLARMARTIRERMNVRDNEVFTPVDLINARTLSSVINSFFGTSQLSQFLDQTNPLSEITHKRRISALGPGGLSRERAGFEVRDVHYSHYGRLCTIETPEGPNIGLISTLCVHAKINDMGFIETPYRKVHDAKVSKELTYLSAEEEDLAKIAQANTPLDEKGNFTEEKIVSRETGDFPILDKGDVEFMDVAPNQIVGLSASLIPFLEHDDANRALMGSNMQRQAVPLLRPDVPIVGTGLEAKAARDARIQIHADGNGVVEFVDANEIHVRYDRDAEEKLVSFEDDLRIYRLTKFIKTNQETCINLNPAVKKGQKVKKGDFLTEGYATQNGEIALGKNLKVAFMPWKGYNFEDAIVISERVVKEDMFTSVHISEYELEVRDTKLGEEELTPDIPNVSEEATKDLDENGIIRIGAQVKEGDILIGKITPKGESDPTPEEKLLRAIFGDKAGDAKDASLKAPNGVEGVVIGKKLFQRAKKDKNAKVREKAMMEKLEKMHEKNEVDLMEVLLEKLTTLLANHTSAGVGNNFGEIQIGKGAKFTEKNLRGLDYANINPLGWTGDKKVDDQINTLLHNYNIKFNEELGRYKREKFNISIGDELPAGVLKLAKVYLAVKRKLKVGDKMAGRHGNKGIVAKIVRHEDMPFLEDGTPVDIVLNPLGVPSRMNLGQIYETILGWTGEKLGLKFATPIFDGATVDEIAGYCKQADIPMYGHTYLYDGETGERFHQKATVGIIYVIKLHHMVDDKMHARSIGPYSLITQQPLGGKAQFGGQRFGEMEVWALEAYGASNILQELLTIKSDDIIGRAKTYESIVKGENVPRAGVPESFNVLVHELRGLGLDLKFE